MRREKEILRAYNEQQTKLGNQEHTFMRGAKWADAHPHWISVEDYSTDELPPLIDKNNPYGESVQVLFVVILDGIQYVNKGAFDYDTGVWHSLDMQCSFCKENITHWCYLPQPPVLSNSENTGKEHLIDANKMIDHFADASKKVEEGGKE